MLGPARAWEVAAPVHVYAVLLCVHISRVGTEAPLQNLIWVSAPLGCVFLSAVEQIRGQVNWLLFAALGSLKCARICGAALRGLGLPGQSSLFYPFSWESAETGFEIIISLCMMG